jgi:hypothetical protein
VASAVQRGDRRGVRQQQPRCWRLHPAQPLPAERSRRFGASARSQSSPYLTRRRSVV